MVSRGMLDGKSNVILALIVVIVITISGIVGAFIGTMFWQVNPSTGPEYEPLDVDIPYRPYANYTEYDVDFTLDAPQYELEPDLSNVINLDDYPFLSEDARDEIADHYLVAVPSSMPMFYDLYALNHEYEIPSFVTSDSVLHAYHVLYDVALRRIEENHFMNHIGNLSRHMVDVGLDQYVRLTDPTWRDCAQNNVAFFSVAAKLHDPNWTAPDLVEDEVDAVLSLIDSASGFSKDWFMDQQIDFSQFVPRGHYTKSDSLKRYFKTAMWFGRVAFRLQPDDDWRTDVENIEKGRRETAQAILACLAFSLPSSLFIDKTAPLDLWQEMYDTTSFFVSTSDDLTPEEYLFIIDEVYNDTSNYTVLCDDSQLSTFIATAMECRGPQILGGFLWDFQDMNATKGLRFMGQRFIPDSYMFTELTHREVPDRFMPKALDIMAVLGSERAWELLDDQKHYQNYTDQIDRLKDLFDSLDQNNWTQSLYWNWLYTFKTLLEEPEEGNPSFMLSEPWVDKQLTTCLGTWTELRHDTILYAKQSYSHTYGVHHPPPGYVEPVPEFYSKLSSLCKMMIDGLSTRGLNISDISSRLDQLHSLLRRLQTISEKELSGISLDDTEWETLENIGQTLARIEGTWSEGGRSALIADVHTDPNNGQVLEEATGNPMVIYVAVPTEDGEVFIARGAMYSHYEFSWPMNDRLSDEAWWDLMDSVDAPEMADWMGSFVLSIGASSTQLTAECSGCVILVQLSQKGKEICQSQDQNLFIAETHRAYEKEE